MNRNSEKEPGEPSGGGMLVALEYVTGVVLALVLAALVWVLMAAYRPAIDWGLTEKQQVLAILSLLTAALTLVSVVALLHTRRRT